MKKSDALMLFNRLKEYYPDATCSLDFKEPFQLVVAVMLSAQCTDERVNKTTPCLLYTSYCCPFESSNCMYCPVSSLLSAFPTLSNTE